MQSNRNARQSRHRSAQGKQDEMRLVLSQVNRQQFMQARQARMLCPQNDLLLEPRPIGQKLTKLHDDLSTWRRHADAMQLPAGFAVANVIHPAPVSNDVASNKFVSIFNSHLWL